MYRGYIGSVGIFLFRNLVAALLTVFALASSACQPTTVSERLDLAALRLASPHPAIWDLAVDRSKRFFAVSSRDGTVVVRTIADPREEPTFLRAPPDRYEHRQHYPVAISPDGLVIALGVPRLAGPVSSGSTEGQPVCGTARVYFFARQGGEWRLSGLVDGVSTAMRALAFSPDGKLLAAGLNNGQGVLVLRTPELSRESATPSVASVDSTVVWRGGDDGAGLPCESAETDDQRDAVMRLAFERRSSGEQLLAFVARTRPGGVEAASGAPRPVMVWLASFAGSGQPRVTRVPMSVALDPGPAGDAIALSRDSDLLAVTAYLPGKNCPNAVATDDGQPVVQVYRVEGLENGLTPTAEATLELTGRDGSASVWRNGSLITSLAIGEDGSFVAAGLLQACRSAVPDAPPYPLGNSSVLEPAELVQLGRNSEAGRLLRASHFVVAQWRHISADAVIRDIGYNSALRISPTRSDRALALRRDGSVFEISFSDALQSRLSAWTTTGFDFLELQSSAGCDSATPENCAPYPWNAFSMSDNGTRLTWREGVSDLGEWFSLAVRPTTLTLHELDPDEVAPTSAARVDINLVNPSAQSSGSTVSIVGPSERDVRALISLGAASLWNLFNDPNQLDAPRFAFVEAGASKIIVGTARFLKAFDGNHRLIWCRAVPADVARIVSNGDRVVTANSDGRFRWYRAADGVQLAEGYAEANGARALVWTGDLADHWTATANGGRDLGRLVTGAKDRAPREQSLADYRDPDPEAVFSKIAISTQAYDTANQVGGSCIPLESAHVPMTRGDDFVFQALRVNGSPADDDEVFEVRTPTMMIDYLVDVPTNAPPALKWSVWSSRHGDLTASGFIHTQSGKLAVSFPPGFNLQPNRVYWLNFELGPGDDEEAAIAPQIRTIAIRWTGPPQGSAPKRRVFAILIGVNNQTDSVRVADTAGSEKEFRDAANRVLPKLSLLAGAQNDALAWERYLRKTMTFTGTANAAIDELCVALFLDSRPAEGRQRGCASASPSSCFGRDGSVHTATRKAVLDCLQSLTLSRLTRDDLVVFAFAGHGLSGRVDGDAMQYLALSDDFVSAAEVAGVLGKIPASVLLFIDACRDQLTLGSEGAAVGPISGGALEHRLAMALEGKPFLVALGAEEGGKSEETSRTNGPSEEQLVGDGFGRPGGLFTQSVLIALQNSQPHGKQPGPYSWHSYGAQFDFTSLRDAVANFDECATFVRLKSLLGVKNSQRPQFYPAVQSGAKRALPQGAIVLGYPADPTANPDLIAESWKNCMN